MPTYSRGDIVLVDYLYTNGRGSVVRPAIVVSTDESNAHSPDSILLAQITTNLVPPFLSGDFLLTDWRAGHLDKPSKARMTKLVTVQQTEIIKVVGHLSESDLRSVDENLRLVLGL